jgi:glutamate racemase
MIRLFLYLFSMKHIRSFAILVFLATSVSSFSQSPIGVFDSGTGGLTVLEAILTLDAFNNKTGKPGADGKKDFVNESFQYLADQANMPYGNYAAEKKTDLLKENILLSMDFLRGQTFMTRRNNGWNPQRKSPVKMLVLACNTATAYALTDIRDHVRGNTQPTPVIGVIDAGSKAALLHQQKNSGTIGVFATAGTVASDGYPRTLRAMASEYGLTELSIISQGGFGLAESIDRDWSYYVDTASQVRAEYKGPSLTHKNYPIRPELMHVYRFDTSNNRLLCEYDDQGKCTEVQLNDPANYTRYHLVSLLEKMRAEKYPQPLNTLILGCTHYPYMRDTITSVLRELYQYREKGEYIYRAVLSPEVELIDPSVETAKEAYLALRKQGLQNSKSMQFKTAYPKAEFFITVPNPDDPAAQLQPDGWFAYAYKYGRTAGVKRNDVRYVPFDRVNVSASTYGRFQIALPAVYGLMHSAVGR